MNSIRAGRCNFQRSFQRRILKYNRYYLGFESSVAQNSFNMHFQYFPAIYLLSPLSVRNQTLSATADKQKTINNNIKE